MNSRSQTPQHHQNEETSVLEPFPHSSSLNCFMIITIWVDEGLENIRTSEMLQKVV